MNKFKKIATAVVSIVMAGTMVGSLAACNNNGSGNKKPSTTTRSKEVPVTRFNATEDQLKTVEVEGGRKISVLKDNEGKVAYPSGTQINANIIDSGNADRHISYDSGQIATYWTAIDGYTYVVGDLKPAWWQLGQDLGIKFNDVAQGGRNGSELTQAVAKNEMSLYTLINSSVTNIEANKGELLDLSKYLDYMPNFRNFLSEYQIVEWSLQMDKDGGMYYIPYFDGNDDIEKYELVQRDWVKVLLDEELPATDTSITYLAQYQAKNSNANSVEAAVESFMGKTGSWKVATTKADGSGVGELEVNYDNVITALKDSNSDLAKAVIAAGVTTPQSESGNIIDIQNQMITETKGAVKGSDLVKVLREYIKVAYKLDGAAYAKLSDVFVSASAGWDADLMAALYRCVVTNFKSFNDMSGAAANEVYALAGREAKPQRENDLIALAGELYGVRGLESRYEYLYIDANGDLQDARFNEASYDAAAKLNALAKEGLLYTGVDTKAVKVVKTYAAGSITTFMLHDYVQTQTQDGFKSDKFDFAPIVTPVSKWDDGTGEKVMRFTESWRSVKNSGVAIPKAAVTDPNVLSAVISFVDYLFSNDGQIIGSYGPMSTNGDGADANGFWYGENGVSVLENGTVKSEFASKVTTVDNEQYFLKPEYRSEGFMYNNVFYKGMAYKDKQIPIMTKNNSDFYRGGTVNGVKMATDNQIGYKKAHIGNYTDYARGVVGAALPIGNKDQGFEYQCTAACGLDGAAVVATAINNGTIKHVKQTVDTNSWWYTVVPSVLPLDSTTSTAISAGNNALNGDNKTAAVFNATSGTVVSNVYIDLAFWGYGSGVSVGACGGDKNGAFIMTNDAASLIAAIKDLGSNGGAAGYLEFRVNAYKGAWNQLKDMKL